jgi:hypothetical protein
MQFFFSENKFGFWELSGGSFSIHDDPADQKRNFLEMVAETAVKRPSEGGSRRRRDLNGGGDE